MTDLEIKMGIAELDGGEWLYNPKAENPHRIWIGRNGSISHRYCFEVWDGKKDIPMMPQDDPMGHQMFREYIEDRNEILQVYELVLSKMSESNRDLFKDKFEDALDTLIALKIPKEVFITDYLLAHPKDYCIALLKASDKWKE